MRGGSGQWGDAHNSYIALGVLSLQAVVYTGESDWNESHQKLLSATEVDGNTALLLQYAGSILVW